MTRNRPSAARSVERMNRWLVFLACAFVGPAASAFGAPAPLSPDDAYGPLFEAVQRSQIFPDQKTFVDCVPKTAPADIVRVYQDQRSRADFDLKRFVQTWFLIPEARPTASPPSGEPIERHIASLWTLLRRDPDRAPAGSSLLPLPNPYIVPGGRFREVYYWDSYFTMLGLRESGQDEMIRAMVENFAYLINNYGFIPNGNRSYYLSRSQPPFFSLMVDLLAEQDGASVYAKYLPALERELAYWMDQNPAMATRHGVPLPDGAKLARYYDQRERPRPEAFLHDVNVTAQARRPAPDVWRDLRSAAESGWDFSSRWLVDSRLLQTIRTTQLAPVDLNCLLWHLETTLAKAYRQNGDTDKASTAEQSAERRKAAVLKACWSAEKKFFVDYDLAGQRPADALTLAGLAPLFFHLATPEQAEAVKQVVEGQFLRPGGVVTTLVRTGQQWDAPNGWAPLQWMTIQGLENYGHHALAAEIARRWLELNRKVYERTGKMMEKYNVEDLSLEAGGGEYPSQDGFGWTNGVYLALAKKYGGKEER